MKKYLKLLYLALFTIITLSLASCSKDDDEPNGGSNTSHTFTVNGVKYTTQRSWGNTATFTDYGTGRVYQINAEAYPLDASEFDYYPRLKIDLYTPYRDITKGETLEITDGDVNYITGMMEGIVYKEIQSGKITVSEISSSSITLNFANLKMINGSNSIIMNGTISFDRL